MLGFPAMSTFRKSSAGAEVKRGYVRVATAVATKSAPPPPNEVQERPEDLAENSENPVAEGAVEVEGDLLETVVPQIFSAQENSQEGENFSAMDVDDSAAAVDTADQVILTTEEALVHSDEGFPVHVESAPTPPTPESPSPPPLDADQPRARTPTTPPATPRADKPPINRWGADKPPLSYAALIALVLDDMPDGRGTLNDLYRHVTENFPFYSRSKSAQWQNSIRHNLSLHPEFIRIKKDTGRGGLWTVKPGIDRAALIKVKGEKATPPPTPPTPVNGAEARIVKASVEVFKVPEPVHCSPVAPAAPAAAVAARQSSRSGSPKRQSLEEFLGLGTAEASTASADKTMTVLSAMDCDNSEEREEAENGATDVPMPPKGRPHQQRKAKSRPAVAVPPPAAQAAKSGGRFSGSMDYWEQYDPEEASRTGQAVVTTEEGAPASEICFLCGSAGQVRVNETSAPSFSKLNNLLKSAFHSNNLMIWAI